MPHGRRPPTPGDRNVRALREHQHTQFVERVRAGLVKPLDRFSDPIDIEDMVLLSPTLLPLIGEVHSIEVLPLPQQPPEASGFVKLMVVFSVPSDGHVNRPIVQLIIKKKRAEWKSEPAVDDPTPKVESDDDRAHPEPTD